MDELKNALNRAGLDSVPFAGIVGFDPDSCQVNPECMTTCYSCEPGCTSCSSGSSKGGS